MPWFSQTHLYCAVAAMSGPHSGCRSSADVNTELSLGWQLLRPRTVSARMERRGLTSQMHDAREQHALDCVARVRTEAVQARALLIFRPIVGADKRDAVKSLQGTRQPPICVCAEDNALGTRLYPSSCSAARRALDAPSTSRG